MPKQKLISTYTISKAAILEAYQALQDPSSPTPIMDAIDAYREKMGHPDKEFFKGDKKKEYLGKRCKPIGENLNSFADKVRKEAAAIKKKGRSTDQIVQNLSRVFSFAQNDMINMTTVDEPATRTLYQTLNSQLMVENEAEAQKKSAEIDFAFDCIGEPKKGEAWIRESLDDLDLVMKGPNEKKSIDGRSVREKMARIYAVRMLASERRQPIELCTLTPKDVLVKTRDLLQDHFFDRYLDYTMTGKNHGLDWTDSEYVMEGLNKCYPGLKKDLGTTNFSKMVSVVKHEHEEGYPFDPDIYGFFLPEPYSAYIRQNGHDFSHDKRKPLLDDMLDIDDQVAHAAKMMAAISLVCDKGAKAPMNQERFREEVQETMASPGFRIMAADPKALNNINMGKMNVVANQVQAMEQAFSFPISQNRLEALEDSLHKLTRGPLSDPRAQ